MATHWNADLPDIGGRAIGCPTAMTSSFAAAASDSVTAARLAEDQEANVLLIEAGGTDDVPAVMIPAHWPSNLGSERDWGFVAQPNSHLRGRSIPLNMGKLLGGGSSINVMMWARGHQRDWNHGWRGLNHLCFPKLTQAAI